MADIYYEITETAITNLNSSRRGENRFQQEESLAYIKLQITEPNLRGYVPIGIFMSAM